jgi:hypothetical protein
VTPHGALQPLVQCKRALLPNNLLYTIYEAVVFVRLRLVLHTNLDELEGDDHEGFGGTGGCACEDGEGLGHLIHGEELAPDLAPLIVCSELGGTLRRLHHDGGGDATV